MRNSGTDLSAFVLKTALGQLPLGTSGRRIEAQESIFHTNQFYQARLNEIPRQAANGIELHGRRFNTSGALQ